MHLISLAFVILSVWGEVEFPREFPTEEISHIYDITGEDVDDGQLRCYSCNTLLEDDECERLSNNEEALSNLILKCPQKPDEVLQTCIFRKDEEFARIFGLQDGDNVGHMMVIEECQSGEECLEKPSIKHPFLRNLVPRRAPPIIPQHDLLKSDRSGSGGYKSTQCFKLKAKGLDGRGFTIRGCANNNVEGCLIGNYIDTDEFECYLCNEQLCNGVFTSFFKSYVTVISFLLFIFML